ncbi:MAG: hypothetical protein JW940_24900 [Polyangiaceae bacterium]|nr:hypothetical protein [Polyangiaceae bacterium]
MKLRVLLLVLAALGIGAGSLTDVAAAGKPVGRGKASGGTLDKQIEIAPEGIRWGMTAEALAKLYDKYFDALYLPRYKNVEPGVAMERLDAEVKERKALIRRNKIDFGTTPTGVDNTPLKPEYSYGNGEAMSRVDLSGDVRRNFFFFSDRLWKIYDEYPLRNGSPLGLTFEDAVTRLSEKLGSKPARVEPDYANGRNFQEAVWTGKSILVRAVNREPILGLVFIDPSIQSDLPRLRRARPPSPTAIDHDVADIRINRAPQGPPPKGKK